MTTNEPISKAYDGWERMELPDGRVVLVRDAADTTPPHLQRQGTGRKGSPVVPQPQPDYSAQWTWLEAYMLDSRTHQAFDKETMDNA